MIHFTIVNLDQVPTEGPGPFMLHVLKLDLAHPDGPRLELEYTPDCGDRHHLFKLVRGDAGQPQVHAEGQPAGELG